MEASIFDAELKHETVNELMHYKKEAGIEARGTDFWRLDGRIRRIKPSSKYLAEAEKH